MPEKKLEYARKPAWDSLDASGKKEASRLATDYASFISRAKTERETIAVAVEEAVGRGFKSEPGGDFYRVNRHGSAAFGRRGKKPASEGFRLIVSHVDTPRLDLKPQPLFEEESLGMLRTHYYGGIKKYQWVTLPLSLHGVVVLRNGECREVVIGEETADPVFTVTDLLPHLAKEQMEKKMSQAIDGEALIVLFGAEPARKTGGGQKAGKEVKQAPSAGRVKKALLEKLNRDYGMTEEDLVSAELKLVPAGPARDLGLDRSMILAYGQDDRICSFASLRAFFAARPSLPSVCLLVDREEIGSEGVDSIQSDFLISFMEEFLGIEGRGLRRAFARSKAISADVDAALDPAYREVVEAQNAPRLGFGTVLTKYTGHGGKYASSEASAEYVAWLRGVFTTRGVPWQTGELGRIDKGGGGTVAKYLARYNLETIDIGPPLLSMHSPWEVSHKADLYSTWLAYRAFYES